MLLLLLLLLFLPQICLHPFLWLDDITAKVVHGPFTLLHKANYETLILALGCGK